jgi:predicted phosphodiesterase
MRKAATAALSVGGGVLGALALCGMLDACAGTPPPAAPPAPPAPPEGGSYRVAVLGDSQKGITNLRRLFARLREEKPAFHLHTGDLVSDDDEGHYRLLGWVLRDEGNPPLHLVPGNHDVKRGPDRFVRSFGPLERSFSAGDVAWVLLDNSTGRPPDPKRVEERIRLAGPAKAVVLAMHVPPFDATGAPLPAYGPFLEWLERSGVAYLLCGHVHAYLRIRVGATVVVVNGIGGDSDAWQYGQRVCATLLEVDGGTIRDRLIEIEPSQGLWDHARHFAVGHVSEQWRRRPWGMGLLLLAASGAAAWGGKLLLTRA